MTRRRWRGVALAYMGAIFWFSSQSGDAVGLPPPWDKVAHFAEFAGLGFVLGRAAGAWTRAWAIAAVWGALDEVHQVFVPGRQAGWPDWLADVAGAFAGAFLGARRGPGGAGR